MYPLISLLGIFAFLGICVLFSRNRRAINWRTVGLGVLLQFTLGIIVLYWEPGNRFLQRLSYGVKDFLALSTSGSDFVFGVTADRVAMEGAFGVGKGFVFAFQVLPTIVFFSAFIAVLWHMGVMKWLVRSIALLMVRFLGTSGAETLAVASNIFVGQTEAPFLIKPFLPRMTKSELMTVMTGGYATIAGGVFALYVFFGVDPGHLIVASVMSAPAAIVCAKIFFPETEKSETFGDVPRNMPRSSSNLVEAATTGTIDGLKLAVNVGAILIAFLGLVAVVNWLLSGVNTIAGTPLESPGYYEALGPDGLTLQKILGWAFAPFAAILGVEWQDIPAVGQLLGTKIAVNELLGYEHLKTFIELDHLRDISHSIQNVDLSAFANLSAIHSLPGYESMANFIEHAHKLGITEVEQLRALKSLDAIAPQIEFGHAKDLAELVKLQAGPLQEQILNLTKQSGVSDLSQLQILAEKAVTMSKRSITIATYALCGFANLGSIGIQIGGIAAICPERRKDLADLAVRAMMAGAFASWMTACVAGVLI